jgi:hypothetical protein
VGENKTTCGDLLQAGAQGHRLAPQARLIICVAFDLSSIACFSSFPLMNDHKIVQVKSLMLSG